MAIDLSGLPKFNTVVEAGVPVLVDGWVAVFYLPAPLIAHASAARDCIRQYLLLVKESSLRWTIDEDGDTIWLSDEEIEHRLQALDPLATSSLGFRLMDTDTGVSGHRIRYAGLHLQDPVVQMRPNAVSLLFFSWPTESVASIGLERICAFADHVAATLPTFSGYLSPAFLPAVGVGEPAAFERIRQLSRRFRCLDIPFVSMELLELGRRVKGPYWRNYLCVEAFETVLHGDLTTRLASQGVGMRSLGHHMRVLQIMAAPASGDTNRREDVSAYQALAAAFAPLAYRPTFSFPSFEPEETIEWFERFIPLQS